MSALALLDDALASGLGTGAQCVVLHRGVRVEDLALGRCGPSAGDAPITPHTSFDLASVTKVAATTTVTACLVRDGVLDLDAPVHRWLPDAACGRTTIRALLAHRSGLPAWRPLFERPRAHPDCAGLWPGAADPTGTDRALARRLVLDAACAVPCSEPTERRYSDVGFLILTALIERAAGAPLDTLFDALVATPLGVGLRFRRLSSPLGPTPIPPTGCLRPREPAPGQEDAYQVRPQVPALRPGEVDDDNAWACDGVAGHAGLFGSARDLATLGQAWLDDLRGDHRLLPEPIARAFATPDTPALLPVRSLGWDRVAPEGSTAGRHLGRAPGPLGGLGHLGFTGTSVWIDPAAQLVVALTTHRTFPSRTAQAPIRALRPALHDAIWERWCA